MYEEINEVTVEELAKNKHWVILDVRTDKEWQEGHVQGALHIELAKISARLNDLPKNRPIAVICRSGSRSHKAAVFLQKHGFHVVNVKGGMQAWLEAHFPMVTG